MPPMTVTELAACPTMGPRLPEPRGPISALMQALLFGRTDAGSAAAAVGSADPYGDDLQLALYVAYELHYRGFAGVADEQEWDPDVLALRTALERRFLGALRAEVRTDDADVDRAL